MMGGGEDVQDQDIYRRLKYECTTLFVSLTTLEKFTDRRSPPHTGEYNTLTREARHDEDGLDSVRVISSIRTGSYSQLGAVSLDVIGNRPYVCVVKRPNTLIMERLDDKVRTELRLPDPELGTEVSLISCFCL